MSLGFPAQRAGAGVQGHNIAIVSRVEHEILKDGHTLGPYRQPNIIPHVVRELSPVLPNQIPGRCIQRLDPAAGHDGIHHPAVNDRDVFRGAGLDASRPHHTKLAHVLTVDLFERTEALRIVGSAEHQPIVRAGVQQHLPRDGRKVFYLRKGRGRENSKNKRNNQTYSPDHFSPPFR